MPQWFNRSRELAAANLLAFVCAILVLPLVPGFAAAVRVVREPDPDGVRQAWVRTRDQVRQTFRRDWWLGVVLVVFLGLGAISLATAWAYFEGVVRVALMVVVVVVHLLIIAMIITYAHAAGSLPLSASGTQVTTLAMTRLRHRPVGLAITAVLFVLGIPLWVFPPLALAFGLVLPAWLLTKLWTPLDARIDWSAADVAAPS